MNVPSVFHLSLVPLIYRTLAIVSIAKLILIGVKIKFLRLLPD